MNVTKPQPKTLNTPAKPGSRKPAPETDGPAQETARRLKTIKAHCAKIIEALNQADEETTNQGLLQVLELVQTLAGDDSPLVANIEAMRAALE